MKKLLKSLFVLSLVFSCFTIPVLADEGDEGGTPTTSDENTQEDNFDVSGSKVADPIALDSNHRNTTVTLSLPSAEYKNAIDIVFALDSSSSAENSTVFIESVNTLFASILEDNPNIDLKIGIIRFRGRAFDAIDLYTHQDGYEGEQLSGLVEYTAERANLFTTLLSQTKAQVEALLPSSGSNTHSGIVAADLLLAADTDVPDSHKYVILATDGKSYIWNDENNEPTTIFSQFCSSNKYTYNEGGKPSINQKSGYNKYDYFVDVLDKTGGSNIFKFQRVSLDGGETNFSYQNAYDKNKTPNPPATYPEIAQNYQDLYDSTSEELSGVTKWDVYATHADQKGSVATGEVTIHDVTNGAELFAANGTYGSPVKTDFQYYYEFTPNQAWLDLMGTSTFNFLQGNPFAVIDNKDGTYTFNTDEINPDYYMYHVDSLQKGTYKAGHAWTDLQEKYNCAVITTVSGSRDGGVNPVRFPFIAWLLQNTEYSADVANSDDLRALFKGIDNSIRYMVAKGVVTDKITEEFTVVDPETPFVMTKSGVELNVSVVAGEWYYYEGETEPSEGEYPYIVSFDAETKTITWTINVPIENSKPLTLSYELEIDKDAAPGYHFTNESAILTYWTTDDIAPETSDQENPGEQGGRRATKAEASGHEFTFERPRVIYNPLIDLTVTKVWDDKDYLELEGYERPEEVTINLLTDGEEELITGVEGTEWPYEYTIETTVKLNEDNELTYTFKNLNRYSIVVTEDSDESTEIDYSVEEDDLAGFTAEVGEFILAEEIAEDADRLTGETDVVNTPAEGEDVYTPITVKIQKYAVSFLTETEEPLKGAEFTLTGEGIEDQVFVSGEDGTFEIEFTAPGTYTLTETKVPEGFEAEDDPTEYTFVVQQGDLVKVELNEETGKWDNIYELGFDEATLELIDDAEGAIIVYNYPELAEFTIIKTWKNDKESDRPEYINFIIYADGEELGQGMIAAEYEWELVVLLPVCNPDGSEIEYTVEEVAVEGYRSEVTYDAETRTFEIINTPVPHTGDRKDFRVWGLLIAAIIMAVSALMVVDIKKKAIYLYR